jgi:uncharacterized membrane protein
MNSRINFTTLLVCAIALLSPASALAYSSAPLTFCNKSPEKVILADGYHSPGVNDPKDGSVLTGPFVSEGWHEFAPGECQSITNPFGARYMFWFAVSWSKGGLNTDLATVAAMHNTSLQDSFCIGNYFRTWFDGGPLSEFTFEDENASTDACDVARGNVILLANGKTLWVNGRDTDTWVNATVNFTGQ